MRYKRWLHGLLIVAFPPSGRRVPSLRGTARYCGDSRLRGFPCWDQFLCMAFAQLTYHATLRDIEACLRSSADTLLPHDCLRRGFPFHPGGCQRNARLTHLRPISRRSSFSALVACTRIIRSASNSNTAPTHWTPLQSTCAWRCSLGLASASARAPSNCTR